MAGLILKLSARERVAINGTIVEFGDKPTQIRIEDPKASVLRCRDALRVEDVDTPVKQIYYAIQLLLTWDLEEKDVLPAIDAECIKLQDAFETIDDGMIPTLRSMLGNGNYYSAMCLLRQIMVIEANLLERAEMDEAHPVDARVA